MPLWFLNGPSICRTCLLLTLQETCLRLKLPNYEPVRTPVSLTLPNSASLIGNRLLGSGAVWWSKCAIRLAVLPLLFIGPTRPTKLRCRLLQPALSPLPRLVVRVETRHDPLVRDKLKKLTATGA